ncbi:unnamed protein product [Cladocopium goreaui]|uniref:ABC transporter G family member 24 (ABC transporter ABCG.24) (AtABCG24) (Probable white-brown complex homolog protein 25) (AtWBC25) n=1 Tax=Cladocopium goreaui TaxID=2562237 RepID=A0A9P1BL68_9DINO|nr:unnamed protein product [Cladocopium goreaui]
MKLLWKVVYLLAPVSGQVCQLLTEANKTLQDSIGFECEVSGSYCNCSTSLVKGEQWLLVNAAMNSSMFYSAKPGQWYLMDSSGRCVAAFGPLGTPSLQTCPPGFYCLGGLEAPRSCNNGDHCPPGTGDGPRACPKNYFCPIPAADVQPCPAGGHCPGGTTRPQACAAGHYCRFGDEGTCPQGHFCPFGTEIPRKCNVFASCPEGSKSPDRWFFSLLILAAVVGFAVLGSLYYSKIVDYGFGLCALTATAVGLMWLVDEAIALFLSLAFVSVAANWALLMMGQVSPAVASGLVAVTGCVAVLLLWLVHPPWAAFMAGLLICCSIAYLMSRQDFCSVIIGRISMLAFFLFLIFEYSQIDPAFTIAFGVLFVCLFLGIIVSYAMERRRQALPFLTRWRFQARGEMGLFESEEHGVAPALEVSTISPEDPQDAQRHSTRRESGHRRDSFVGVSFGLEDVAFALPDGKKLLKDVSFGIAAGQRVAVMGPSGSGKTTLLGVLSGRASYGRVTGQLTVGGRSADDMRCLRPVTGFVPQDDVLHGELTVKENLNYQAMLRLPADFSKEEVAECVVSVARDLNLYNLLEARVGTPEKRGVSGGQRKRVSIGMELVAQPLLLFADEPTSGLDSTTSHEVVRCLNGAAARLGSTVVAVIHQPRYDTLQLFDDLILLAVGGFVAYAGPTEGAVDHFQSKLHVRFSNNSNPADVLLDAIASPEDQEACIGVWKSTAIFQAKIEQTPLPPSAFHRERQPFFRAVLIYMDRCILQTIRASVTLAINYSLCAVAVLLLCLILTYERLDQFEMQAALASLFLMLLQGVAAQQIFGGDLLITWREARVGMPMIAYFVAKDLAAYIEVTLSSAVFAAAYGYASGCQIPLHQLFAGAWAFVFAVFGLNYIFSIILSPGAAQMSAVVTSFLSFCTAGVYQPQLSEMAAMFDGRGWMVPALSPIRWLWGYYLTAEMPGLTPLTRNGAASAMRSKGYDLAYLSSCKNSLAGMQEGSIETLQQAWIQNRGWVCSPAPLLLLGILFRFLAGCCLLLYVSAQTSGWARFFAQSEMGAWKFAGHFFMLLVGSCLIIFLFAEVWVFGSEQLHFVVHDPFERE